MRVFLLDGSRFSKLLELHHMKRIISSNLLKCKQSCKKMYHVSCTFSYSLLNAKKILHQKTFIG